MNVYKHWQAIEDIINETLDLQEELQIPFIEKKCKHNPDLLTEALDYYYYIKKAEGSNFLDSYLNSFNDLIQDPEFTPDKEVEKNILGIKIGSYQLTQLIGEGGMGSVYLAERIDGEFCQKVAIKFLRGGFFSSYMRKRFKNEKRILAKLNHTNIAKLLDGGIAEGGTPYLTMEYVKGLPVDEYCKVANLGLKERLELFCQIFEAVQFAHSKLIIHRDLKPQNILVTPDGQIKITDFGIAKFLNPDVEDNSYMQTREGHYTASYEFAAPEQFRNEDPTIATDVYGLGALLYLLLTDVQPHQFKDYSISEIESVIQNKVPAKPTQLSNSAIGMISTDLEAIIMKALCKEPEQRYSSVEAMADDIKRLLKGLPVKAFHSTFGYRAVKFMQRNRTPLIVFLIILAGVISLITFHNSQLAQERDLARQEAEKAEQISSFLVNLFEMADPGVNQGEYFSALEMVDQGIIRLENLSEQPQLNIVLYSLSGDIYRSLMELEKAAEMFKKAYILAIDYYGEEQRETADLINSYGNIARIQNDYTKAEKYYKRAYDIRLSVLGENHPDIACSYNSLGLLAEQYYHDIELAKDYYQRSLNIYRRLPVSHNDCTATVLNNFGDLYRSQEEYLKAVELHQEALDLNRALLGNYHPEIAITLNFMGRALGNLGKDDQAEASYREALAINKRVYGEGHVRTIVNLNNLGYLLWSRGEYQEAKELHQKSLEIRRANYGNHDRRVATSLNNLGLVIRDGYSPAEARFHFYEAKEIMLDVFGTTHSRYADLLLNIAISYQMEDHHETAVDLLKESLIIQSELRPENHWQIGRVRNILGSSLAAIGEYNNAEHELKSGLEILRGQLGDDHQHTKLAITRLDIFNRN